MHKGSAQVFIVVLVLAALLGFIAFFFLQGQEFQSATTPKTQTATQSQETVDSKPLEHPKTGKGPTSSAKGVVIVEAPTPYQEIRSPLLVTGFVYGNKGKLTIKLKQKESGAYVTEDKVINIAGKADKISFAEAIQFGLPVEPQVGVLELIFQDGSGQGLDDQVFLEVNFPGDLGKGE